MHHFLVLPHFASAHALGVIYHSWTGGVTGPRDALPTLTPVPHSVTSCWQRGRRVYTMETGKCYKLGLDLFFY